MTHANPRGRSGITLTEILISILIMGIGLISLATLFPLGLLRLREAQRNGRSTLLAETAQSDIATQNLFAQAQFAFSGFYPQPGTAPAYSGAGYGFYDPWIQDWPLPDPTSASGGVMTPSAVYRGNGCDGATTGHTNYQPFIAGPGLPVVFDPLFWAAANKSSTPATAVGPGAGLYRFASGIGFLRDDPNPVAGSVKPSAWGLQRLTSLPFLDVSTAPHFSLSLARSADIFASHDDPVLLTDADPNQDGGANDTGNPFGTGAGSPVLPYLNPQGSLLYDWSYTWIFTGQRSDVSDRTVYDGSIVVFHNRPFGVDQVTAPNGGATVNVPAGERVVEAIFSYGRPAASPGYSPNERIVLLRWPASEPDPEVRVGGWIADVTYELGATESAGRFGGTGYPGQRCHWYRIARKTEAEGEIPGTTSPPAAVNFRRMILTLESPVRAQTLLQSTGDPVHVNAALVSPYVVNVFPKVFYSK